MKQSWTPESLCRSVLTVAAVSLLPAVMWADGGISNIPPAVIVSASIEHSLAIRASDQDIEAAAAREKQTFALGLPSVNFEGRAGRYDGLKDIVFAQGVVIPAVENHFSASISLLQPVFTGGLVPNQRQSAGYQRKAAGLLRDNARADAIFYALSAYWIWSKAFYAVAVLDASAARTKAHADDVHNMQQAGLITDNEVLATDVLVDRTRLQLEQARRNVDLARARVEFLAGRELPAGSTPERAGSPSDETIPIAAELMQQARRRPEYTARNMEVMSAESLARAAQSGFYPQVYLAAKYEQANPNMLYIPPADEWHGDAFAGISIAWNLLDWGLARGRADEAAARAVQARLRLQQLDEQTVLEIREAMVLLQDAFGRVALTGKALVSANRNLVVTTDLWQSGVARHSEVLDAHAKLTEAQYEETVARSDVALARAALDHATGKGE